MNDNKTILAEYEKMVKDYFDFLNKIKYNYEFYSHQSVETFSAFEHTDHNEWDMLQQWNFAFATIETMLGLTKEEIDEIDVKYNKYDSEEMQKVVDKVDKKEDNHTYNKNLPYGLV